MAILYVGIDPGASGAAAVLRDNGSIYSVCRFEKSTLPDTAEYFRTLVDSDLCVMLEQVASMPKQGVRSMFTFGRNFGHLEMVLTAYQIPYDMVTPQVWQRRLGIQPKAKTETKERHKKKIRQFAQQRRWPKYNVTADIADALLIADYCRRLNRGILSNLPQKKG